MTTILRFFLSLLLAPGFAVVAQAVGSWQNDFSVVDAGFQSESRIQDRLTSSSCNYDSIGALLQQRRSLDGKASDDDRLREYGESDRFGAVQSLFAYPVELVAAKTPTSTAIVPYYPPNNGFAGATTREFLMPGQTIDRFGGSGASRFFSPTGTPEAARALPPGTAGQPLRTFEVVKPFEIDAGTAAPWFGQPGGGSQFRTPVPMETLLKRGILRER